MIIEIKKKIIKIPFIICTENDNILLKKYICCDIIAINRKQTAANSQKNDEGFITIKLTIFNN